MQMMKHRRIGEILIEMGMLTPTEIDLIIEKMKMSGRRFGETGIEEGLLTDQDIACALAEQFQLQLFDPEEMSIGAGVIDSIPSYLKSKCRVLPVEETSDLIKVVVDDPTAIEELDEVAAFTDKRLVLLVTSQSQLTAMLDGGVETTDVLREVSEDFKLQLVKETDKGEEVLSLDKLTDDTSPIIKLIDSTLIDALKKRASDIHIESRGDGVMIKFRIDGVLYRATEPLDSRFQSPIISRIKVMSELDISERRIPQDGRFKLRMKDKSIDFRVSIMPSVFGEDAVIRILDKESIATDLKGLSLEALGFTEAERTRFRRFIREPYGMVLVTGPTGSGKTTTLYAALSEIHTEEEKIITIEDPVEYQLRGVVQVPVNERKGLTFAKGLRSILRHDPDKIMVGEIRDPETAQIAVQSALTGHLVFTTVHANNAFDVLGRFLHMGLDPYSFVSSLNCVLAQRLVRKLCPDCKKAVTYDRETLIEAGLDPDKYHAHQFYEEKGCDECFGVGYKGRSAIVELLGLNDEMREMIVGRASISELKKVARKAGTHSLRQSALNAFIEGATTLREVNRVTFAEQVEYVS